MDGFHAHPGWEYGPSGPRRPVPVSLADTGSGPALPHFEAALARSKAQGRYPFATPEPPPPFSPFDPNHPDLALNLFDANTSLLPHSIYASNRMGARARSYSPPGPNDVSYDGDQNLPIHADVEKALLENVIDEYEPYIFRNGRSQALDWGEKNTLLGVMEPSDNGDLSLPLPRNAPSGRDLDSDAVFPDHPGGPQSSEDLQHFGPAPTGKVGRRTHHAAGYRRIKHQAVLDDHGIFAVEMPIPTRLAQFLPMKGVEEQMTTR